MRISDWSSDVCSSDLNEAIKAAARLAPCPSWRKAMPKPLILWFEEIAIADVPAVGGKNASLGEMTAALSQKGVKVPSGFATTAEAYRAFVHDNQLEIGRASCRDRVCQYV